MCTGESLSKHSPIDIAAMWLEHLVLFRGQALPFILVTSTMGDSDDESEDFAILPPRHKAPSAEPKAVKARNARVPGKSAGRTPIDHSWVCARMREELAKKRRLQDVEKLVKSAKCQLEDCLSEGYFQKDALRWKCKSDCVCQK